MTIILHRYRALSGVNEAHPKVRKVVSGSLDEHNRTRNAHLKRRRHPDTAHRSPFASSEPLGGSKTTSPCSNDPLYVSLSHRRLSAFSAHHTDERRTQTESGRSPRSTTRKSKIGKKHNEMHQQSKDPPFLRAPSQQELPSSLYLLALFGFILGVLQMQSYQL